MSIIGKALESAAVTLVLELTLLAVNTPLLAQYGPRYSAGPQETYCASNDGHLARCQVPWRDVMLVQQMSRARCIRDRNWGVDRYGIWVDQGCRGQFAPVGGGMSYYGPGPQRPPDRGWGRPPQTVRCESRGGHYQLCPVDMRRSDVVRMVNQLSGAACRQGRSWGWSRDGIWVNHGCRAEFVVERGY